MLITYFCGEAPICQPLPPLPDFPLNHMDFTLINTSGVWPEVDIGQTFVNGHDVYTFNWVDTSQSIAQQPLVTSFALAAAVPEPTTFVLLLAGFAMFAVRKALRA